MRIVTCVSVLAVGCGDVDADKQKDAAVTTDVATSDTPMMDAYEGLLCVTDSFDGSALAAHWTAIAGAAPTYAVGGSKISISDAPLAVTPSNADESWINNYATDLGNQLGMAQPIGTADFIVRSHIDFTSSNPELTYAGIAVTDSAAHLLAFVGAVDGQSGSLGGRYAAVAGVNSVILADADPINSDIRIERTASVMRVFIDNAEIVMGTNASDVAYVSIVAVPYKDATQSYPFGNVEFTHVEVCR